MLDNTNLTQLLTLLLTLIGLGLIATLLAGFWVLTRVRRLQLPEGADAVAALRRTPISVVILLDLLDFTLDFLGAPVAWSLLGYLGLGPLRTISLVEALIPGTQLLPTMTVAWLVVRLIDRRRAG